MPNELEKEAQSKMAKSVEAFAHELSTIRTGRASTALLDSIEVEAYGSRMKLNQMANVAAPEPRLLLITPWDRLEHVASYHYPWLPVKWLLRDRYDSAAHLAAFGRPVVVAVAEQDDIVPPQFGNALYRALPEPRLWLPLPGAGHNDWPARVDAAWWQQAVDFMLTH